MSFSKSPIHWVHCWLDSWGVTMTKHILGPVSDVDTLAEALSRLSVLAHENRDRIDSIDINPFLVLPEGQGACAVDALIVPREDS